MNEELTIDYFLTNTMNEKELRINIEEWIKNYNMSKIKKLKDDAEFCTHYACFNEKHRAKARIVIDVCRKKIDRFKNAQEEILKKINECKYMKEGDDAKGFMEDKHEEACTNCKYLDDCMEYCKDEA